MARCLFLFFTFVRSIRLYFHVSSDLSLFYNIWKWLFSNDSISDVKKQQQQQSHHRHQLQRAMFFSRRYSYQESSDAKKKHKQWAPRKNHPHWMDFVFRFILIRNENKRRTKGNSNNNNPLNFSRRWEFPKREIIVNLTLTFITIILIEICYDSDSQCQSQRRCDLIVSTSVK